MGKYARQRQERVGEKLKQIRDAFGWSQGEMLQALGLAADYERSIISNYENDHREPPLFVLLEYSRIAGICLDELVDDAVDLPKNLPAVHDHHRSRASKRRSRKSDK